MQSHRKFLRFAFGAKLNIFWDPPFGLALILPHTFMQSMESALESVASSGHTHFKLPPQLADFEYLVNWHLDIIPMGRFCQHMTIMTNTSSVGGTHFTKNVKLMESGRAIISCGT